MCTFTNDLHSFALPQSFDSGCPTVRGLLLCWQQFKISMMFSMLDFQLIKTWTAGPAELVTQIFQRPILRRVPLMTWLQFKSNTLKLKSIVTSRSVIALAKVVGWSWCNIPEHACFGQHSESIKNRLYLKQLHIAPNSASHLPTDPGNRCNTRFIQQESWRSILISTKKYDVPSSCGDCST